MCSTGSAEKVVSIVCEGGGLDVYRVMAFGEWRYFEEGSSISIDDHDSEFWKEWRSDLFSSLSELLNNSSIRDSFTIFTVIDLSPEHRDELLHWAQESWKFLRDDHFERFPRQVGLTPEDWVAGRHRHR